MPFPNRALWVERVERVEGVEGVEGRARVKFLLRLIASKRALRCAGVS